MNKNLCQIKLSDEGFFCGCGVGLINGEIGALALAPHGRMPPHIAPIEAVSPQAVVWALVGLGVLRACAHTTAED